MTPGILLAASAMFMLASTLVLGVLIRITNVFYVDPEGAPFWLAASGVIFGFVAIASGVVVVLSLCWWALQLLGVVS